MMLWEPSNQATDLKKSRPGCVSKSSEIACIKANDKKRMQRIASQLFDDSNHKSLPFLHKLSVSFSEVCKVRHTISRADYTSEEMYNCWYTEEENSEIRDKCVAVVRTITDKRQRVKFCTRGLESLFSPNYAIKMQVRREAKHAVFLTQDEPGATDELIGEVYSQFTSSSALWARRMGLLDEKASEACYGEDAHDLFQLILQKRR